MDTESSTPSIESRVADIYLVTNTVMMEITSPIAKTVEVQLEHIMAEIDAAAGTGRVETSLKPTRPLYIQTLDDLHPETLVVLSKVDVTVYEQKVGDTVLDIRARWAPKKEPDPL